MWALKLLLDNGADPRWRNKAGNSVLNLCAKRNDVAMVEELLKSIVNPMHQKEFINQKRENGKLLFIYSFREKIELSLYPTKYFLTYNLQAGLH